MKPIALVIGGTRGLGAEISKLLRATHKVYAAGRNYQSFTQFMGISREHDISYVYWDIDFDQKQNAPLHVSAFYGDIKDRDQPIDLLVYCPGFYQPSLVSELNSDDIDRMLHIGLTYPVRVIKKIIEKQNVLPGFIAVTSTSQWSPHANEPLYAAVKAGLAAFAHAVSFDPAFGRVMVAAPARMKPDQDTSKYLDPKWVAQQIVQEYQQENLKYKFMKILRDPAQVIIDPSTRYSDEKDPVKPFGFRFLPKE